MTESEWLTCNGLKAMLNFLGCESSERKRRLFACACCRRIWELLTDERSRNAVVVAERFADGSADELERHIVELAAGAASEDAEVDQYLADAMARTCPTDAALGTIFSQDDFSAFEVAELSSGAVTYAAGHVWGESLGIELASLDASEAIAQCDLLRDIFGNPYRSVRLNPSWLTPAITALARSIYDERVFDRMPELSDELARAGCDNADVLNHCRNGGPHVRGCWVVDLVLGKS